MSNLLRVMLVSPVGEIGGAEQVFLSLAKRLPEYGVEPFFACLRPGPLEDKVRQLGIPAFSFRDHRLRQLPTVLRGIKWLEELALNMQIDLLHANHAAHLYSGSAGKRTNIPELWHIHDYPYHLDLVERLSLRVPSRHVLFTTEKVKSGYKHLLNISNSVIAPTCIDTVKLLAYPAQEDIRTRYGLGSGPLFLTVARLQEHKGLHHLIAAIPQVIKRYPEARFAIVGKASGQEQLAYHERLTTQCSNLGVTPNVHFFGYVPDEDLVALYREASALVHPATSEGYGLTLLEAMALGLPVVAAAADGPKEIIVDEENGLLVPLADPSSLADSIICLLNNPGLAHALSLNGIDFASKMSLDAMVSKTVDIYRKMADENPVRTH